MVKTALEVVRRSNRQHGRPRRTDFNSQIWLHDDVRLALHKYQRGKCCYCERKRDAKREPDIEHFRPKGAVDGDTKHKGYWWLAYKWSNLFFCCKTCNEKYKTTRFPLRRGGIRARTPKAKLRAELPVLPDLAVENPEPFIGYLWDLDAELGWPTSRGADRERGASVIDLLGLDRDELNEDRGRLIAMLESIAQKMHAAIHFQRENTVFGKRAVADIRRQTRSDQEHAGFRRFYFTQVGLGAYVSDD